MVKVTTAVVINAHNSPLDGAMRLKQNDFIGKGISRGVDWSKFQLRSSFQ